jgi:membrane protease subunit (stomatin/prohibitin family)
VSNTPSDAKDGTPIDEAQVEIFSVANSYGNANDLADKVRAALDRKSSTVSVAQGTVVVQSIHYTNEVTEVSADRNTYVSIQDYTIRIKR